MKKIKYMFQRLTKMNYKSMFEAVNRVSKKTNKNKFLIFWDVVICGLKYQAGYVDYEYFNMYDLTKEERKTILTRGKNNQYVSKLNKRDYFYIFRNKNSFNEKFNDYLNRDWIYLNKDNYKEFDKFLNEKKEVIVKPNDAACGKGVRKIKANECDSKKLYNELLNDNVCLVEEVATQHEDMAKLHPASINTIRIVTLVSDYGVPSIVFGVVRIGTNNNVVDNFNNGGVGALVDLETGKLCSDAIDNHGNTYKKHPTTGIKIKGYQIPMWDEVKQFVLDASKVVPEMRLIGWDVCIGKDKPCFIEANEFPGHDIYRVLLITGNKTGMVPVFEKAINKK